MKTKIFTLAIAILGFTSASFAQSSATATASAELLTPLSITSTANLDFGKISASQTAGTAILTTAGAISRTGGVGIISGTPSAAKFTVTGAANAKYSMLATKTLTLTSTTVGSTPLDLELTYDRDDEHNSLNASGSDIISVGGTLKVGVGAAAGIYTSENGISITVAYE